VKPNSNSENIFPTRVAAHPLPDEDRRQDRAILWHGAREVKCSELSRQGKYGLGRASKDPGPGGRSGGIPLVQSRFFSRLVACRSHLSLPCEDSWKRVGKVPDLLCQTVTIAGSETRDGVRT
jgi:hypothetical protein